MAVKFQRSDSAQKRQRKLNLVRTAGESADTSLDARVAAVEEDLAMLNVVYAARYDQDADPPTVAYLGQALPGAATNAPAWRIQRLTFSADGDVTSTWADGDADFNNIWDDRASLTYS